MYERVRKRYLALKVESEEPLSEKDLIRAIWSSILQLFGEYGASQTNLYLVEFNPEDGHTILRCSHKMVDIVRASIAAITRINEKSVGIHVVRVSGTLRALRKKVMIRK
ncbi:MAG: Rpp14/Pop5 family protein [Candidatus Bathyarchaeota archaeon]|nr:Rpp14/Pop5 family protein [Candidatus Bathyarchaeota archaeon]